MEYLKNLCNYYFVKEINKDTEVNKIYINKIDIKPFDIKSFDIKPFDFKSFDNQVINKINSIMFNNK